MTVHQPEVTELTDAHAVQLLKQMIEIDSPSYQEAELAHFLAGALPEFGYKTEVDAAGNLIADLDRGAGPTVMLLGHLDTVGGHVPVREQDGLLYGRGTVDAKTPLAAMLCAAVSSEFAGRLLVIGAVEEETPLSRGAMHILETHQQPDALIIGEPSGWRTVVLGYKGKLDFWYRVSSEMTHPTNPTPKASELAADCWALVLDLLGPDASHARFDQPGPNLTSISGDLTTATAELSIRTPLGFDAEAFLTALRARVVRGEIELINYVDAVRVERNDPVVRALSAAIRQTGSAPGMKVKTATSDMNTLAERWRVPMATYGPGDSTLDHSEDEHVVLTEYLAGIRVLSRALDELCHTLSPLSAAIGGTR